MRISNLRRTLGVAAATVLAGTGLLAAAGPAAADDMSARDTCVRGEVCVYDERHGLIASSGGNLSGSYGPLPAGGTVVNNGVRDPGVDHITYTVVRSNGTSYTVCLHYPEDGNNVGSIPINGTAKNIHWMNAC